MSSGWIGWPEIWAALGIPDSCAMVHLLRRLLRFRPEVEPPVRWSQDRTRHPTCKRAAKAPRRAGSCDKKSPLRGFSWHDRPWKADMRRRGLNASGRFGGAGVAAGLLGGSEREQVEQEFLVAPFVAEFFLQALLQEAQVRRGAALGKLVTHVVDDLPVLLAQFQLVFLGQFDRQFLGPVFQVDQIALRVGFDGFTIDVAFHFAVLAVKKDD